VTVEEQDTLPDPLALDPPVEGQGEWLNTSIYLFTPAEGLRGGTSYTATVRAGLEDVTGGLLAEDYTWTFTTLPPDVVEIVPSAGSTGVKLEAPVTVSFTQPMDPAPLRKRSACRWSARRRGPRGPVRSKARSAGARMAAG